MYDQFPSIFIEENFFKRVPKFSRIFFKLHFKTRFKFLLFFQFGHFRPNTTNAVHFFLIFFKWPKCPILKYSLGFLFLIFYPSCSLPSLLISNVTKNKNKIQTPIHSFQQPCILFTRPIPWRWGWINSLGILFDGGKWKRGEKGERKKRKRKWF